MIFHLLFKIITHFFCPIELRKRNIKSWDIRDREIRNRKVDMNSIEMVTRLDYCHSA